MARTMRDGVLGVIEFRLQGMKRRVKEVKKVVDTSRVIVGTEDMVLLQNSNEDGERRLVHHVFACLNSILLHLPLMQVSSAI